MPSMRNQTSRSNAMRSAVAEPCRVHDLAVAARGKVRKHIGPIPGFVPSGLFFARYVGGCFGLAFTELFFPTCTYLGGVGRIVTGRSLRCKSGRSRPDLCLSELVTSDRSTCWTQSP